MKKQVCLWLMVLLLTSISTYGQYNTIYPFYDEGENSWAFIDTSGQHYNNLWFDTLAYTQNKEHRSDLRYYTVEKDGKVGLIRETGDLMLKTEYQRVFLMAHHLFEIHKDGMVGGFNGKKGEVFIPVEYDRVRTNSFNNCIVQKGNSVYLFFTKSSKRTEDGFDSIQQLNDEYYIGKKGGFWGLYLNESSEQLIGSCDSIKLFQQTYFLCYKNGQVGLVNNELKVPFNYSSIQYINPYYAVGQTQAKNHLLSLTNGQVLIHNFKLGYSVLHHHFFKYKKNGQYFLRNNKNEQVLSSFYSAIDSFSSNLMILADEQGKTVIDTKENIVVNQVTKIEKGHLSFFSKFKKNELWGAFSNRTRSVVVDNKYTSLAINRRMVKAYNNAGVVDIYKFNRSGQQTDFFKVLQEKYGSIRIKKMNPNGTSTNGRRRGTSVFYSIEKDSNTYNLYDQKSNKVSFITHKVRNFYDRIFIHQVDSVWNNGKVMAEVTVNSGIDKKWSFINKKGKLSSMERYPKCIYDTIFRADPFNYFVKRNQLYGLTDLNGMKYTTDYDTIILQGNGLGICKKSTTVSDVLDEDGMLISNYSFYETGTFQEGVLQVHTPFGWNYINEEGEAILDKFRKDKMYHRGKYMGKYHQGKFELMKYHKKMASFKRYFKDIPANKNKKYDSLAPMESSKFWVYKQNNRYGAINPTSGREINAQYQKPFQFDENGLAIVKVNRRYGVMNVNLKYKLALNYSKLEQMNHEGYLRYSISNKGRLVGVCTKSGKMITSNKYQYISDFFNGIAVIKSDGLYGILNTKGKEILAPQFTKVMRPSEGSLPVQKEGKWGLVTKTGEWLLAPTFNKVELYREGLWFGTNDTKGKYFDAKGKVYTYRPKETKKVTPVPRTKEQKAKLTKVEQEGKFGLQNKDKQWVVFPVYDSLVYHRESETWEGSRPAQYNLQKGDKCKFPRDFEHILYMRKHLYKVEGNGMWGYYDISRKKWLYPFDYHKKMPVIEF